MGIPWEKGNAPDEVRAHAPPLHEVVAELAVDHGVLVPRGRRRPQRVALARLFGGRRGGGTALPLLRLLRAPALPLLRLYPPLLPTRQVVIL